MVPSPAAAAAEAHRLFFAILPPPDVAATIGAARAPFGVVRSRVADHRLHMTVGLSIDYPALPDQAVAAAIEAGGAIDARRFRIVLDQAAASVGSVALRPSEPLPGLLTFQRMLAANLAASGFPSRPDWRFNPHVTLGYRKGAPFAEPILPISWLATEFVLIHSHVGLTRHDLLCRWPLRET